MMYFMNQEIYVLKKKAQFTPVKNLWKISAPALGLYIRSTPRFILYHTKCTLMTTSNLNRSILKQIFLSFRAMFYRERPRLVGVDKSGNRYFEAPPNKASEHTHLSKLPKRFFLMPGQNGLECSHGNMDVELSSVPPEWHSWLSHRRSNPPTEEEIEANAVSMINRLSRAAELEVYYMLFLFSATNNLTVISFFIKFLTFRIRKSLLFLFGCLFDWTI
ncbi:unnamed protein product [Schistosoma bovis]|nr:unnamed protein product [Schistosoma bovis]